MDTECDVDRFAGRGFNLSALYALLMLVIPEIGAVVVVSCSIQLCMGVVLLFSVFLPFLIFFI